MVTRTTFVSLSDTILQRSRKILINEDSLFVERKIGEDVYRIAVGDTMIFKLNGKEITVRDAGDEYSAHRAEWKLMFAELMQKIALAESLNDKILPSLIEPYIQEAVLDRLVSQQAIPDNAGIIRLAYEKRIKKLEKKIPESSFFLRGTSWYLKSPSEMYTLRFGYSWRPDVSYGTTLTIKAQWSFLQHFDEIEKTIDELATYIRGLKKLMAGE